MARAFSRLRGIGAEGPGVGAESNQLGVGKD
jgi:hypothetical protein